MRRNIAAILKSATFSARTVPLALAAACLASFGLLVIFPGFFLDDWHHIYFASTRGLPGLWELFLYDGRPYAAYFFYVGFKVLGFNALPWQVFSLLLRFLTFWVTWLYLRELWPDHKRAITWAVLIAAVYPLFKQQSVSVAYSLHWTGFLLFSISMWAMIRAVLFPHRFWLYLPIAVITDALQLILLEYFAGLELIRPVILWMLLSRKGLPQVPRLVKTARLWLPYALLVAGFGAYRLFLIPRAKPGFERNDPTLIINIFKTPIAVARDLLQAMLQDTTAILYTSWHNVISPQLFDLFESANRWAWLVMLASAFAAWFYLRRLRLGEADDLEPANPWYRTAFLLGMLLTVFGPIPAWVTDQHITTDNPLWSDRFGLASMVGAGLVLVALLEGLVGDRRARTALFCALFGLSIGWHVLNSIDYHRAWDKQYRFYWQLAWRAPFIEPNTALLSDSEIFSFMTEGSTSFALSVLYPKPDDTLPMNYGFFRLTTRLDDKIEDLLEGMPLHYQRNFARFVGNSRDSLVIFYEPKNYECLWVLNPQDNEIRAIPEITRQVAPLSNLGRIQPEPSLARPFPTDIFGREPKHTWCYYFEKAELARQEGDWQNVVELWRDAEESGFAPGNGVEYIPFIEGFTRLGEWHIASEMTRTAHGLTRVMSPSLCATWERIASEGPPSEMLTQTWQDLIDFLGCQD